MIQKWGRFIANFLNKYRHYKIFVALEYEQNKIITLIQYL